MEGRPARRDGERRPQAVVERGPGPYGNASFYFVEMAAALGLQPARTRTEDDHGFSPEQLRQMDRLHHEMDVVLQVFLRHAEVPLGSYPLRDWLVPEGK